MKAGFRLFFLSAVILLTTAIGAYATTITIPPLPDFPQSEWTSGSSVKYQVQVGDGDDLGTFGLRVAILGTEHEQASNTDLYWVEFDLTDISGIPEDAQQMFVSNYGELPQSIRMNMLIPKYDLTKFITDPSKVYYDFSATGFIRKLYFQYNRQVPYDVDPTLIGGFILPLIASEMMGSDLPQDFMDERNLGLDLVEDPTLFTTEVSESSVTTDAGDFDGKLYSFTGAEDQPSGTFFFTESTPALPFVSYNGDWMTDAGSGNVEIELVAVQNSGAESQIVGTPTAFNLQNLMYGS